VESGQGRLHAGPEKINARLRTRPPFSPGEARWSPFATDPQATFRHLPRAGIPWARPAPPSRGPIKAGAIGGAAPTALVTLAARSSGAGEPAHRTDGPSAPGRGDFGIDPALRTLRHQIRGAAREKERLTGRQPPSTPLKRARWPIQGRNCKNGGRRFAPLAASNGWGNILQLTRFQAANSGRLYSASAGRGAVAMGGDDYRRLLDAKVSDDLRPPHSHRAASSGRHRWPRTWWPTRTVALFSGGPVKLRTTRGEGPTKIRVFDIPDFQSASSSG